jgi:glycosyltransferase involved in cell wall biosynthesis
VIVTKSSSPEVTHYLAAIGDSTDLNTWSNIPYYLLQAGLDRHLISEGLPLKPEHLRFRRLLWNLSRPLLGSKPGGYQYTERFARRLLSQYSFSCDNQISIISLHPMLPACPWPEGWQVIYYIDMTTRQTFDVYGVSAHISRAVRRRALQQEREAFNHSSVVVCMCQWAADSVINDYSIDAAKVHVVPGGANLDEHQLAQLPATPPPPVPSAEQPLRLGFLGKEWQRKGGPFLLELAEALQQRGLPTVIRAIGPDPAQLPAHPALQPLGFINKQRDTARFVAELRSWHFGTLFSDAEASPRSNLECLRLGVPLLSHAVGGIASTLPDAGCGQLFAAHPSAAEVADWIAARLTPYEGYLAWRAELAPRWREFTWAAAVEQLAAILQPS